MALYWLSFTTHVLAAMLWLGGMFFLALVGAPVLRAVEPAGLRAELFARIGQRFRTVGWAAIAVLLLTGVLNLYVRGLLSADVLLDGAFWTTPYGRTLALKLLAVAATLAVQAVHDFGVGPAASRVPPGSPEGLALRCRAAWLARGSALCGILVVVAAVRLARGG
jgi:putative copper resistance protein D